MTTDFPMNRYCDLLDARDDGDLSEFGAKLLRELELQLPTEYRSTEVPA